MTMENQVKIEDIKLWLGELLLENRIMQKELMRLKAELEEKERGLFSDKPLVQGKEKEEKDKTRNNG